MRTRAKDAYVLTVDPLAQDLFFLPETAGLRSLFEKGEFFHGRSKAYRLEEGEPVGGIKDGASCPYKELPRTHKSKLSKDRFIDLFQKAMNRGYLLKAAV